MSIASVSPALDEILRIMLHHFESLVNRGFLAPHFLSKMMESPSEVIKFIRQNHAVVADTLRKRLDPTLRPNLQQLEERGILPRQCILRTTTRSLSYGKLLVFGYISEAQRNEDISMDFPGDVILVIGEYAALKECFKLSCSTCNPSLASYHFSKVVESQSIELDSPCESTYSKPQENESDEPESCLLFENDSDSVRASEMSQLSLENSSIHSATSTDQNINDFKIDAVGFLDEESQDGDSDDDEPFGDEYWWELSVSKRLLLMMIGEAIRKCCIYTQQQEHSILQEMMEMNDEMRILRDSFDKYFLNEDVSENTHQEHNENMVRDKFHSIQQKLIHITQSQNQLHEKLRILHSVEQSTKSFEDQYQINFCTESGDGIERQMQCANKLGDTLEMPNLDELQRNFERRCGNTISLSPIIRTVVKGLKRGKLLVFGYIAEAQTNGDITRDLPDDVMLVICGYAVLEECFKRCCVKLHRQIA